MAEPRHDDTMAEQDSAATRERRRFPDLFALIVGLVSLGVAAAGIIGHTPSMSGFDARWMLAAAAVLLGVLLLVGSLRRS